MCGIFGIIIKENTNYTPFFIKSTLERIASISIARGMDSSGIVFKNNLKKEFSLVKGDIPISKLLKEKDYLNSLNEAVSLYNKGQTFQAIGHARLVTNGSQLKAINNQPVVKDGIVGIHNGIIINNEGLWKANPDLKREYDIDTEVLLSLIKKERRSNKLPEAIRTALNKIEGTASCALLFDDLHELALFTNNGSLYYILEKDYLLFASEEYFLKKLSEKMAVEHKIHHIKAFDGLLLNTASFNITRFTQKKPFEGNYSLPEHIPYAVSAVNLKGDFDKELVIDPMEFIDRKKELHLLDLLENNSADISKLKRCTTCILPETFPFIEFDEKGECNYCKKYKPQNRIPDFETLKKLVAPYKRSDGRPDCIVPFSGGRDSTYTLHVAKKELGLNPIAFTYDWGMVTDLARRNIARVCGKLGVENIVISADLKWKRENIRKNVTAWMRKPDLGMIPLFMAGDKYFFYYCNKVKKQTGIDLNIWGINNLENTNFKTGFARVKPQFNKKTIYSLSILRQLKLFGFVGQTIAQNPRYLNQSVFDSLGSFAARYLSEKKDYFHLFDYHYWNETEVESLIEKEYDWEKSIDTDSTWRIGDGTASFYNYIYYTVAGFTENDTFRSNQVREGMLTREQALAKINDENKVRYETLRWYLEIIGVDFKEIINAINAIPKLYVNK